MVYLEGEMFEEVRGAIGLVGLCPASRIDPHANSRRLRPRRVFGGDLNIH